jgi:hypothetical protein
LFAEPLPSNSCLTVAYFTAAAQQLVYMPQCVLNQYQHALEKREHLQSGTKAKC